MTPIAETIKSARKFRGLTQLQLAKMLEPPVSPCYISQIENGYYTTPNPEIVRQLGEILGIRVVSEDAVVDIAGKIEGLTDFEARAVNNALRKTRGLDALGRLKAGSLVLLSEPDVSETVMTDFLLKKSPSMRVLVWKDPESDPEVGWLIRGMALHSEKPWSWQDTGWIVRADLEWYYNLPSGVNLLPVGMDHMLVQAERLAAATERDAAYRARLAEDKLNINRIKMEEAEAERKMKKAEREASEKRGR